MINTNTPNRIRASDLPVIISRNSKIRQSVQRTVQIYVFALMIGGYSKSLKNIAIILGATTCSLSRMLSNTLLDDELKITINRKTRRLIAAYINKHGKITAEIIIDSTIIERSSGKAENASLYQSNGKKVWGHRITNIGILLDGSFYVPLAALSHHTHRYARSLGLSYLTEGMMVRRWLRDHMNGIINLLKIGKIMPEDITFLLDAGYDNADIQNSIRYIGCHFIMMAKSTRSISGFQIRKFFTRNRCLKWESKYLNKDVNGKIKRRKYRIRTAEKVNLARVGLVNAVCSEKASGSCKKKKTRRYLITSRLDLDGREILKRYARRWTIEIWHKSIKQNYGLGDCSASGFSSIQNHISLCIIAYLSHLEKMKHFPSKGTTIEEYLQYSIRKQSRMTLRLIDGGSNMEQQLEKYRKEIFSDAV